MILRIWKSRLTDYVYEFYYTVERKVKEWHWEFSSYRYMKWYDKKCAKSRKRLEKKLSSKKNLKEYRNHTNKYPINSHGKYTGDYRDWIEDNRGD